MNRRKWGAVLLGAGMMNMRLLFNVPLSEPLVVDILEPNVPPPPGSPPGQTPPGFRFSCAPDLPCEYQIMLTNQVYHFTNVASGQRLDVTVPGVVVQHAGAVVATPPPPPPQYPQPPQP